ncbi:MAG: uroporphyrinogen-III C-methyltransferase [Pseudomonadota bacterium]
MAEAIAPGEVWLVGAGPGDPDLLTRKAEALIRAASTVFYDALVGPGVLELIPSHIRRVPVGKRSGRHSKDQDCINGLLLAAAQDGERVVRLKGGDPSVFGRSAEEVAHLRSHGVPVHICPGITAASAAAAGAGVSLTLRGHARRLQFVTAHARAGARLDMDWAALADPGATLAVYMGREAAHEVARKLIAHGMPAETPVLIAAEVSLPGERLLFTRLDLLSLGVASIGGKGPAILLIGEAARGNGGAGGSKATAARVDCFPILAGIDAVL